MKIVTITKNQRKFVMGGLFLIVLAGCILFVLGTGVFVLLHDIYSSKGVNGAGLICLAISGFIWYSIKSQKEKADFYIFCGGDDKLKYRDYFKGSGKGIALDTNSRTLFLKYGKIQKAYPYTDIRNWETISETHFSGGVRKSFIVNVKDIDNPVWEFDHEQFKRWSEILNQEINES